jgi:hypothetical protein
MVKLTCEPWVKVPTLGVFVIVRCGAGGGTQATLGDAEKSMATTFCNSPLTVKPAAPESV